MRVVGLGPLDLNTQPGRHGAGSVVDDYTGPEPVDDVGPEFTSQFWVSRNGLGAVRRRWRPWDRDRVSTTSTGRAWAGRAGHVRHGHVRIY
jgi:hypothetical protein